MHEQKLAKCWRFDERPQRGFDGTLCFVHLERKLVGVVECRHTGVHHGLTRELKAAAGNALFPLLSEDGSFSTERAIGKLELSAKTIIRTESPASTF